MRADGTDASDATDRIKVTAAISRRRLIRAGAAAWAGIAFLPKGVRAAEFEWKFGIDQGAGDPIVVRAVQAFAKIREESGGRLSIKAFPNGILGGQTAMLTQLRSGALEMLGFTGTTLDSVVPLAAISGLGYAFKDAPNAWAAFDGELGAIVRKEIIAKGMMAVGKVWSPGFADLETVAKPIRNPDDIAGMRIRVAPSKMRVDLLRSLGAQPVSISSTETFTALQTHIIDGVDTSLGSVSSLGWAPAFKYISLSEHRWDCYWTLVNMDTWNSLPPQIQAIVEKNLNAAVVLQRNDYQSLEASLKDKFHRLGIVLILPDKASLKAKLVASGYYGRWKTAFGDDAWNALTKYTGPLG